MTQVFVSPSGFEINDFPRCTANHFWHLQMYLHTVLLVPDVRIKRNRYINHNGIFIKIYNQIIQIINSVKKSF